MPAVLLRSPSPSTTLNIGPDPVSSNASISIPADFISAALICLFLTISAVSLRIFTKVTDLQRVQLEDYAILLAGTGFTAFIGLMFAAAGAGLGRNDVVLSFDQRKRALQNSNGLDIVYAPVMFFVTIAILIQIEELVSDAKKSILYWGVRMLMAINAICYSAILFVHIFACNPRKSLYDMRAQGTCIDQSATIISTGSVNIASGSLMLVISVWGVSILRLSMKRNALFAMVLALGSFSCVASVCRLINGLKIRVDDADYKVAIWPVHLWSLAELTALILCACCPIFPRLYEYTQGKRSIDLSKRTHDQKLNTNISMVDLEHQRKEKERMCQRSQRSSSDLTRNVSTSLPKRSLSQNTGRTSTRTNSRGASNTAPTRTPSRSSTKSTLRSHNRSFSSTRDRIESPTPIEPRKAIPRAPIRKVSNVRHPLQTMSSIPETTRLYPHLSYEVYDENNNIDFAPIEPSSPTQAHFPISPTSTHAPLSPAQTEFSVARSDFSVAEVESARLMRILPVYFAAIKKTVSVRVSSHTNLGSPMSWRRPSYGW